MNKNVLNVICNVNVTELLQCGDVLGLLWGCYLVKTCDITAGGTCPPGVCWRVRSTSVTMVLTCPSWSGWSVRLRAGPFKVHSFTAGLSQRQRLTWLTSGTCDLCPQSPRMCVCGAWGSETPPAWSTTASPPHAACTAAGSSAWRTTSGTCWTR